MSGERNQGIKLISSPDLPVEMGNIIVVIWQMGNTSTPQHSNCPEKAQGGLGTDARLCCPVFSLLSPTQESVLNRIWSPETQKGKSHTCSGAKLG